MIVISNIIIRPYDYLPLVIQADTEGDPELFELPLACAPPVHIYHPKYPELTDLGMRWYPVSRFDYDVNLS